ncbi:MAG: 2-phosphosulfolactate phosphatase [Planctomycetaceae bacterium]|nr:2-phosphosulfolactate phosphatase [Planctomycetaceae bacterium]
MSHSGQLNVYALPELMPDVSLAGSVSVVVDILRATTTMIHALASGAKRVIPCLQVEDAFQLRAERLQHDPNEQILLGGERGGLRVEGFDLGNSPAHYTPEVVAGKTLLFSTTNGTRAIFRVLTSDTVYPACFNNMSAVRDKLLPHSVINIVCAGTDRQYTEEDILFAGFLVDQMMISQNRYALNAQAIAAREMWERNFSLACRFGKKKIHPETLAGILRQSRGGENLMQLGLGGDILSAAVIDAFSIAPQVDLHTLEMT